MRMADRYREGVRLITLQLSTFRQEHFDHRLHLALIRMTATNNRFLDRVRRIFRHRQSGERRREQGNAARLPQHQRIAWACVHKGFFDRRLTWAMGLNEIA